MKKKCKGLLALWLAVFMMLSLASPVFADDLYYVGVYTGTPDAIDMDTLEEWGYISLSDQNIASVGIETDKALNTQDDLMSSVHPGLIQTGWNVWRSIGSGNYEGVEENAPASLALDAKVSQEDLEDWAGPYHSFLLFQPTGTMRAFTHQPTESEPYVAVNDTNGVAYQWCVDNSIVETMTDADLTVDGDPNIEYINEAWTCIPYGNGDEEYGISARFDVNLNAGAILTVTPSVNLSVWDYFWGEYTVGDSYDWSGVTLQNGKIVIVAEETGTYTLQFLSYITAAAKPDDLTLDITVTTPDYTPIDGEIAATLSDWEIGTKYACQAIWLTDYMLTSNSVTFTKEPVTEFTVTLDAGKGTVTPATITHKGGAIGELPTPVLENYIFEGWYTAPTEGEKVTAETVINEATTLYARWTEDTSNFWWMLYMMMNTKFEINAAATEGGTITPPGITKVKYQDPQNYIIKPNAGYVIKDVLVDGESVGAVDTYTFEKVTKNHTISAVFALANPYTDIDATDSYYDAVMYLYQNGIMNGIGDGTVFGPDEEVDRAMLFTVLWRLHGSPVVNYAMPFTDVDGDEYYAEAVRWAASIGILKGFEDNTFRADEPLTVEQLCTVLYRYIQREGGGFKGTWMFNLDVKDRAEISDWAFEAMCYFKMKGLYVGEDGELNPQDAALRSQVAEMVYAIMTAAD